MTQELRRKDTLWSHAGSSAVFGSWGFQLAENWDKTFSFQSHLHHIIVPLFSTTEQLLQTAIVLHVMQFQKLTFRKEKRAKQSKAQKKLNLH